MEQIDIKFDSWNNLKKELNTQGRQIHFRQGEIWFASIGQNIGYEMYGKGDDFLRPVFIFRKINQNSFVGIPLTSKEKNDKFHSRINFNDKINYLALTQIKTFDSKRLKYKTGSIGKTDFEKIEKRVVDFYDLTPRGGGYTCQIDKQRVNSSIVSQNIQFVNGIDGLILTPLRQIDTPKGAVWHAMKKSDTGFDGFGEAYFSFVGKGEIKGWKKHLKMTLNIVVPAGAIKFRLIDDRDKSLTKGVKAEFSVSVENYCRLTVPSGVWMCFEGLDERNMLLNLASIEHDPEEAINCPLESF